jgi:3-hydroxyisobutyrate dehydrogenase-like beta-hydroxyacid dehydrogenase
MADVAVLGTGRMGSAMAQRVAGAGHRVTVWNRTEATARVLAESMPSTTIAVARTPAGAVKNQDVILSALADGDATRAVLLDPAVLASLTPGAVVCDLGTSGAAAAAELATGLRGARVRFVDAPVSGSVPAVEAGTLLVMAGGDPDALDAARTVLGAFARKIFRVGPAGAGQTMKLAVNLIVHDLNAAVSEALMMAKTAGIAAEDAYDVFEDSVIAAPFVVYKRAAFLYPQTGVAMSLDLVHKDLRLITGLADELGVSIPVTDAAAESVAAARSAGYGPDDMASLTRFLAERRSSRPARDDPR